MVQTIKGIDYPPQAGLHSLLTRYGYGIEARNTSVTVRNSTFELMKNISKVGSYGAQGGIGIYAEAQAPNIKKLDVADGAQVWHNEFYENRTGICSWHNYSLQATGCRISSSNIYGADPKSIPNLVGQNGIEVNNYIDYNVLNISNNVIDNMLNGIVGFSNVDYAAGTPNKQINVVANQISISVAPSGPALNNQNYGIIFENLFVKSGGAHGPAPAWVLVQNNLLNGVYNGISLSNFFAPYTNVQGNTVNMQQADKQLTQAGITENHGNNNWAINNIISSTGTTNDNARGIKTGSSWAPVINCNIVSNIGRGFEFYGGYMSQTNWLDNTMTNNGKGLVLNNASIGAQPTFSPYSVSPWAATNYWTNATTAWAGKYHTWTISSLPANSPLYVLFGGSPDLIPVNNSGLVFLPTSLIYSSTTPYNGIVPATALDPYCGPFWRNPQPTPKPQKRLTAELIAIDSVTYGSNEERNRWMAQAMLYRALTQDTALQNSSVILQSFYSFAANSRYAWLSQIEDSLAAGNDASATSLLTMSPPPSNNLPGPNNVLLRDGLVGDTLIANYLNFYNLYLNWHSSNFSLADSFALNNLAQLCPHLDGTVIYQARTLLRVITHDYTPYTNDCETLGNGGNARKILASATEQQYYLSPNPNDGKVQLRQSIEDKSPIDIAVYNVLGASVYKSVKRFDDRTVHLNLTALAPGMYYILLNDNVNQTFTLRFVKN